MNDKKFIEIEGIASEIASLARYGRSVEGQEKKDVMKMIKIEVMTMIPLMPKKRAPRIVHTNNPNDAN